MQADGYLIAFSMSLTVIRPFRRYVVVDDQQLLDLVRVQDVLRLVEPRADRNGNQILTRHDLGDRPLEARFEPQSRLVRMPTSRPSLLPSS